MARPLDHDGPEGAERTTERSVARSTARAFAAAISALLVTTLVIDRSDAAISIEGTAASSQVTSGIIELSDDDGGESLFDLANMAPGRPHEQCLAITYNGTILPAELGLVVASEGDLGPWLSVTIEQGDGAAFGSCENFVAQKTIWDGTLDGLAQATVPEPLPLTRILNQDESTGYRFTFDLADEQDALGRGASAAFLWEVRPA